MRSNLYEELQTRRALRKERNVEAVVITLLVIAAVVGFGLCIFYQIPIVG